MGRRVSREHSNSCGVIIQEVFSARDEDWVPRHSQAAGQVRLQGASIRRPAGPLRYPQFPAGLPELTGKDKARVEKDNSACSFVLTEIEELLYRGGGSVRENPFNIVYTGNTLGKIGTTQRAVSAAPGTSSRASATTWRSSIIFHEQNATISIVTVNGNHGSTSRA